MAAAGFNLSAPDSLKAVNHYMKLATEYDQRDPAISYYCRMYAAQKAMSIDRSSPDSKKFIIGVLDYLEKAKAAQRDNELITNNTAGQAYVEQQALKLFLYADQCDRAGNFSPATIKCFYSSNLLIDVLTQFGELSEEVAKCQRYAKWKAVYIKQCTSQGIPPQPGPVQEEGAEQFPELSALHLGGPTVGAAAGAGASASNSGPTVGAQGFQPSPAPTQTPYQPSPLFPAANPYATPTPYQQPYAQPNPNLNPSAAAYQPAAGPSSTSASAGLSKGGSSAALGAEILHLPLEPNAALADKEIGACVQLCKSANSALQFQDAKTALTYLQKCIYLLTTGQIIK